MQRTSMRVRGGRVLKELRGHGVKRIDGLYREVSKNEFRNRDGQDDSGAESIKTCRCGALGSVMTAAEGARVPPGPGIVGEAARKPVSIGERWFQLEPQREGNHGEVNDVGVMLVMGVNSRGPAGSVSGVGKHWKRDVRRDVGCLL